MGAVIKINGKEIPDTFCAVDTLSRQIILNTIDGIKKRLDYKEIYTEVNIYGDEKTILSKF